MRTRRAQAEADKAWEEVADRVSGWGTLEEDWLGIMDYENSGNEAV